LVNQCVISLGDWRKDIFTAQLFQSLINKKTLFPCFSLSFAFIFSIVFLNTYLAYLDYQAVYWIIIAELIWFPNHLDSNRLPSINTSWRRTLIENVWLGVENLAIAPAYWQSLSKYNKYNESEIRINANSFVGSCQLWIGGLLRMVIHFDLLTELLSHAPVRLLLCKQLLSRFIA